MTLKIKNLTGGYFATPVIKDVNLTIENGQGIGLIGLNGAGKSTTIKHILGLLRPQKGSITLDGMKITENPTKFKKKLSYIPEVPVLYPELTLKEHIELTILAYNLNPDKVWNRAHELLKQFKLDDKLDWLPIHFSKGMRQKVMIVTAFLADSDLLVVDEPFTGLDPLSVANLIKLLQQAIADQKMVLMTTHILSDAQQVVQKFAVLNKGTIEIIGTLDEIREHYGLSAKDPFDKLYQILSQE